MEKKLCLKENNMSETFSQIVSECKVNNMQIIIIRWSYHSLQTTLPLLDDLVTVSRKLESEMIVVSDLFGSFLETVQSLRDSAVNTQSTGEYWRHNWANTLLIYGVYNERLIICFYTDPIIWLSLGPPPSTSNTSSCKIIQMNEVWTVL